MLGLISKGSRRFHFKETFWNTYKASSLLILFYITLNYSKAIVWWSWSVFSKLVHLFWMAIILPLKYWWFFNILTKLGLVFAQRIIFGFGITTALFVRTAYHTEVIAQLTMTLIPLSHKVRCFSFSLKQF